MEANASMPAKALIAPGYRWRLALIALVCLAFAAWSFRDGYFVYPREMTHYNRWVQMQKEHGWDQDWKTKYWKPYAEANNLPLSDPPTQTQWNILFQYLMCVIVAPIGVYFGVQYALTLRRWIAADGAGLSTSWGQTAAYAALTGLNKERWKTKGIAVVRYRGPQGRERKLVLDDWKYDAPATRNILLEVEGRLTDAQITGGERERKPTDVGVAVPGLDESAAAGEAPVGPAAGKGPDAAP
jgi:hypothetical protein